MFKKVSVIYSISSVFKAGIQMLVGLSIAKYITPEDYGIWGSLNLVITYAMVLQLGTINGVNLNLPIAIGEKNNDKAKNIIETSQSYILVCMIIILLLGGAYLMVFGDNLSSKFFWGIFAITFLIALTFYQDFLTATFRTPNSFRKFSFINIVQALVNFLTIGLIVYYSFFGLIFKSVLVIIFYVVLLHFHRPYKVTVKFNLKSWLELVKVGLPIFLLSYIQGSALSFDRILLIKYTNLKDVGIYTFAYLAFSSVTLLSSSVASYIYPTMSHMYAENGSKKQLWKYLKRNITYIFLGLFGLAIMGTIITPYVINIFFNQYSSSVPVMQILFFAGAFNGGVIGVNVLLSMKKWKYILFYHLFFASLLIICPLIFMNLYETKILGIACGVLVANIINFISAYSLVYLALLKGQNDE